MTGPLKVRFLTPTQIEGAVIETLGKFGKWRKKPVAPPIPIDEMVELYLKLDFAVVDLAALLGTKDVLGATWFEEQKVRIDQSLEGKEGRISFTIAHEVGHWILHRPQYEADKVTVPLFGAASPALPAVVCRSGEKKAPAEWQADQFAARVLMPGPFVQAAFRKVEVGETFFYPKVAGGEAESAELRDFTQKVRRAGDFSNVSIEALRIRLSELGLVAEGRAGTRLFK